MRPSERTQLLKRIAILASLTDGALEAAARKCKWRDYQAGEHILGYQDASTDVLFLFGGRARVINYSADGKAVVFTDLAPSTMFGELAAIDRKPRSAGVEALDACTVAALSAGDFEELLMREPAAAVAALRHIAADARRLSERVFEFSTMVVQNRIQAELLRLAGGTRQAADEAVISPAPSLSDIAGRISTHREAVSRELSRLASIGLLRREGGNLTIADVSKLAKLVEDTKGE